MASKVLYLSLLLAVIYVKTQRIAHDPFYCYSEDKIKPQKVMSGTFNPYEAVRGRNYSSKVSNCTASRFWIFARHGARLPTPFELERIFKHKDKIQDQIRQNYVAGKTLLCASDFELLQSWKFNQHITPQSEQDLAPSGVSEMKDLAARLQKEFPTILPKNYSESHYYFRSSDDKWTTESIKAFASGLFEDATSVKYEPSPAFDITLKPYLSCSLFNTTIKSISQLKKFKDSLNYISMVYRLNRRLGITLPNSLGDDGQIDAIMDICKYEQGWNIEAPSAFCAPFSIGLYQIYEFYNDLETYYKFGYGFKDSRNLYENLHCFLMQDLLKFVESNNSNDKKARIFNGHMVTLQMLFVTFGVFEDKASLKWFDNAQKKRLWRMSKLSPMAGNLAIIRYDCPGGDHDLLFLLNEIPLQIPKCKENGLCKRSFIVKQFERYLKANCTDDFCTNKRIKIK